MKARVFITAVAALLCAGCMQEARADGPYTLRMGLQPGTSVLYRDAMRQDVTQEMMGQEMKTTTASNALSRMAVEAVRPDGAIAIVTSIDSLTMAVKSVRRDTTLLMTDIMGKRSRVIISPIARVLAREVIDSLSVTGMGMRAAGPRELTRFHVLPEAPVSVGGQWTAEVTDTVEAMGGKMTNTATVTYTLAAEEERAGRRCVKITYAGTVAVEGKGAMMGMEIFMEGQGTTSGTVWFDPAAGLVVGEASQIESDVTAALTGQQNMTIPVSSKASNTRELLSITATAK